MELKKHKYLVDDATCIGRVELAAFENRAHGSTGDIEYYHLWRFDLPEEGTFYLCSDKNPYNTLHSFLVDSVELAIARAVELFSFGHPEPKWDNHQHRYIEEPAMCPASFTITSEQMRWNKEKTDSELANVAPYKHLVGWVTTGKLEGISLPFMTWSAS